MSFYSEENRQLLLGLLKNNPTYINNSNYFIKEFNITMHNINNKRDSFNSLMDMNKTLIKQMTTFKLPEQPKLLNKSEIFQQKLSSHEKNFSDMINIKKPEEIDFSDNVEDGDNFKDMDETMVRREKELNEIMKSYNNKDASNWLSSQETREKPVKLKIKENTVSINAIDLERKTKVKKQVRFELKEKNESMKNFFGKLKKKSAIINSDNSIKEDIKNILLKQDLIIEKLDRLLITKN
jgi:hypothetical protein|uniref:Uncharacterized protein n=1 Tax=viral metagenome TaxID=1070528 RepID=A0A6C0BZI9_9ZZZZ